MKEIHSIHTLSEVDEHHWSKKKYKYEYSDEKGNVKGITAKMPLKVNKPKYGKAKTVAFSCRVKVEGELDRLDPKEH